MTLKSQEGRHSTAQLLLSHSAFLHWKVISLQALAVSSGKAPLELVNMHRVKYGI